MKDYMECKGLLKPRTLMGHAIEYTLGETNITIANMANPDSSRRKVDIPLTMLARFISELQEIEKLCNNQ